MQQSRAAGESAGRTIALDFIPPIDADGLFRWFRTRAIAGIEFATATGYTRAFALPGGPGILSIEARGKALQATIRATDPADQPLLLSHARRLFDLDSDPRQIDAVLSAHTGLARSVSEAPGIRLPGLIDLHEALVRAILGQQVTVARARAQTQQLVDELGVEIAPAMRGSSEASAPVTRLFPTAEVIAARGADLIRGPAARTRALIQVCTAIAGGELIADHRTPCDELISRLQSFSGIGPWTAGYVALRFLGAPDVTLPGDVAVRAGARLAGLGADAAALVASAQPFAPWRSYLMMHLWRLAALG